MKKVLVLLAATAAVVAPAATANATEAFPSPVTVSTSGYCPSNYSPVAQAGNTVACVYNYRIPAFRVTTNGCGAGETPYLILNQYGICTF